MATFFIIILPDNPILNKLRAAKDQTLRPLSTWCGANHIKPTHITTLGLVFGLLSLYLLFINYWYFVLTMGISTLLDILDGALARNNHQTSQFGRRYDFIVDHILTLLMSLALCHYINNYFWFIGALFFSIVLSINLALGTPIMKNPSGRFSVFIPALFALPKISLLTISMYGVVLAVLLLLEIYARSERMLNRILQFMD